MINALAIVKIRKNKSPTFNLERRKYLIYPRRIWTNLEQNGSDSIREWFFGLLFTEVIET